MGQPARAASGWTATSAGEPRETESRSGRPPPDSIQLNRQRALDDTCTIAGDEVVVAALRRLGRVSGNRLLVRAADGTLVGIVPNDDVVRRWHMLQQL